DIIRQHHDKPTIGHGGMAKTIEIINRNYYWPKLCEQVKQYVKNCDICQRTKSVRHAPFGLLKPHEAPEKPWKSIAMDFITGLPEPEGYDAIWVVVDRLTKMAHFLPCRTDHQVRQFARLIMDSVIKLHGLPKD